MSTDRERTTAFQECCLERVQIEQAVAFVQSVVVESDGERVMHERLGEKADEEGDEEQERQASIGIFSIEQGSDVTPRLFSP